MKSNENINLETKMNQKELKQTTKNQKKSEGFLFKRVFFPKKDSARKIQLKETQEKKKTLEHQDSYVKQKIISVEHTNSIQSKTLNSSKDSSKYFHKNEKTWEKIKKIQSYKKAHKTAPQHLQSKLDLRSLIVRKNPWLVSMACLFSFGLYWGHWVKRTLFELSFMQNTHLKYSLFNNYSPYTQYFKYSYMLRLLLYKLEKKNKIKLANHMLLAVIEFFPPLFIYSFQKSMNKFYKAIRKYE